MSNFGINKGLYVVVFLIYFDFKLMKIKHCTIFSTMLTLEKKEKEYNTVCTVYAYIIYSTGT